MYRTGVKLDEVAVKNGRAPQNRSILFLLLGIFGLAIVSFAIIQSEINEYTGNLPDGMNGGF